MNGMRYLVALLFAAFAAYLAWEATSPPRRAECWANGQLVLCAEKP